MPEPAILTYADVIDHLVYASGGGAADAAQRDIRTAVQLAYREVNFATDWQYHQTHGRIYLQEPYATGTIAYTHSTRALVISGGSWPSWAQYGRVIINGVVSEIASVSGATATLDTQVNPGADVAAGTSFTLYRNTYPLPSDFRNLDLPIPYSRWYARAYIPPNEFLRRERINLASGGPFFWTVMANPDLPSGWCLRTWGYPATSETFDFTYRRIVRELKRSGHESASRAGTVTCSASASVTGSGSSFSADMVGAILRVSTSTSTWPEGVAGLNPYTEQKRIATYTNATTLAFDSALAGTYSGVKYTISDPVDMSPGMWNALLAGADYHLLRIRKKSEATEAGAEFMRQLRLALEADQLAPLAGRVHYTLGARDYYVPRADDAGV